MWLPFNHKKKKNNYLLEVFAPVDGKLIDLEELEDEVFREGMMGPGFAFEPSNGKFFAPIDGEVVTVFPTKHAYGIQHISGVEILLHIGLDTVTLKGEGFVNYVNQKDSVKIGSKLVEIDLKKIKTKVPSMQTPLVFTNLNNKKLTIVKKGQVKTGDLVATLT